MTIRAYRQMHPVISPSAYVDESALVIGDVHIGDESSIWPQCVIRGDVNSIRIGRHSNIQDGCIIHVTHKHAARPAGNATVIGDKVTVGHRAVLHGCTIEDRCLVGMGAVVMDGAMIRSGVLLGACSLVPEGRELEGGYLWLGTPARKARPLTQAESDWLDYSATHYARLKEDYR